MSIDPGDGHALMAQVRRGETAAFRTLYDTYGPSVMRFLYRLCSDRGLAEDLTQEAFVRVWRAAPRWEPRARVRTWIFEIAPRLAWNALAKRGRRAGIAGSEPVDWSAQATATKAGDPAAPLQARDLEAALAEALTHLSPRLRLVFVLLRLEGCTLRETATIAAIPIGTVKSRAAAAEARLRELLARAGFDGA